jgi:hypothetical protein
MSLHEIITNTNKTMEVVELELVNATINNLVPGYSKIANRIQRINYLYNCAELIESIENKSAEQIINLMERELKNYLLVRLQVSFFDHKIAKKTLKESRKTRREVAQEIAQEYEARGKSTNLASIESYLSAVLNGKRQPKNPERLFAGALLRSFAKIGYNPLDVDYD